MQDWLVHSYGPEVKQKVMVEGYGRANLLTSWQRETGKEEAERDRERGREEGARDQIQSLRSHCQ